MKFRSLTLSLVITVFLSSFAIAQSSQSKTAKASKTTTTKPSSKTTEAERPVFCAEAIKRADAETQQFLPNLKLSPEREKAVYDAYATYFDKSIKNPGQEPEVKNELNETMKKLLDEKEHAFYLKLTKNTN